MQRKAFKQLNKVAQWTNEKVFSSEKTEFSEDFTEFEREVEPLKVGIERLHATSAAFYDQLSKLKPSADPYPPSGSNKDKMRVTEALGLVMIDYGNDAGGAYGEALKQYGRARCKLGIAQEQFSERLSERYIASTETAIEAVNEYKLWRKKMESRRLALDSALHRVKTSKKEPTPAMEDDVAVAQQRMEEAEEEAKLSMIRIQQQEEDQFAALTDLLDAELEYFRECQQTLEELRSTIPQSHGQETATRPRAKSNVSASKTPTRSAFSRRDDESPTRPRAGSKSEGRTRSGSNAETRSRSGSKSEVGRERSDSNASAGGTGPTGRRRSIMSSIGSIGSFGVKSSLAAANAASKTASKSAKSAKGFGKSKYGNLSDDEERRGVNLDSDEEEVYRPYDPPSRNSPSRPSLGNRTRSQSVVSVVTGLSPVEEPPVRRRAITTPSSPSGQMVKVLYDFEGRESDELPLRRGQIIEVTKTISDDWLIGKCDGLTGMFPKAYTEEYLPPTSPTLPTRPILQRNLPPRSSEWRSPPAPRATAPVPVHSELDTSSESGLDFDTADADNAATSLFSATQPVPTRSTANRSRASSIKKPAPPPPPSRRTTSSNNLASIARSPPAGRSRSSTLSRSTPLASDEDRFSPPAVGSPFDAGARSPFEHSDDDDSLMTHAAQPQSLGHGLAAMHLGQSRSNSHGPCAQCGCSDFTQNVFKANGMCSTCFHLH